jgi:hypothetical protein
LIENFDYYIDESGNSGDLAKVKEKLNFGNQPLFALACIGLSSGKIQQDAKEFVTRLTERHGLDPDELKSDDIYYHKPEVYLDLVNFIWQNRLPIFVELVDKRYDIASSIFKHQISPYYSWTQAPGDEEFESQQQTHNELLDYITNHLPDSCYHNFLAACREPSEKALLESFQSLKDFFSSTEADDEVPEPAAIVQLVDASIEDYWDIRNETNVESTVKRFLPIPDEKSDGSYVRLISHVHSIYNLFARLNKYHLGDLDDVKVWHDQQDEFKDILLFCAQHISDQSAENEYETQHADFGVKKPITLGFLNSKADVGIQIADMLAGFCNRYVNGVFYKNIEVKGIYHQIFSFILKYNRPMSPLGVNFVLAPSRRQLIFDRFQI